MPYEIVGPFSIGPERIDRPLTAVSPAGPVSLPWPHYRTWSAAEGPRMAGFGQNGFAPTTTNRPWWQDLIDAFRPREDYPAGNFPEWYPPSGGVPTYGTTTYAPYCGNVWLYAIGGAVVGFILAGQK